MLDKNFNGIEASGVRQAEEVRDPKPGNMRGLVFVPKYEDLTFCVRKAHRQPYKADLVAVISIDGRSLTPFPIKTGNHEVIRVQDYLCQHDGMLQKARLQVGDVERSADLGHPRATNRVGTVMLEVYRAAVVKARSVVKPIELSKIVVREDEFELQLAIQPGGMIPCVAGDTRSPYTLPTHLGEFWLRQLSRRVHRSLVLGKMSVQTTDNWQYHVKPAAVAQVKGGGSDRLGVSDYVRKPEMESFKAQLVALKQEVAWLKSLRDEEDSDDDGDGHAKSEPKREPPPSPRVSPATEHRQPQSQFDFFLEHGYLVEINRPQRALYARRLP